MPVRVLLSRSAESLWDLVRFEQVASLKQMLYDVSDLVPHIVVL